MKLILSLLCFFGLLYYALSYDINCNIELVNEYFNINYDDNHITLNNYDISNVKINFEYIAEVSDDEEYNKQPILFNKFIKDSDDFNKFNYVKTTMHTEKLYFEVNYDTLYYNKFVEVYMFIKNNNISINSIVICISFDKEIINYDGNYILEVKDYVINFSNISFTAQNSNNKVWNKVTVDRFGNYFYIYFPSYKDFIQYKFIIKYDSNYIYYD